MTSRGLAKPAAPAFAGRVGRLATSAIGSVLGQSSAGLIGLAAGSPAPESFGADAVASAAARLLAERGDALQYGDTSGLLELREWIAGHVGGLLGRECSAAETVLTHGSQQGLDLICKALLDPGDVVVVDRPTYVGALQVFRLYGADVVDVSLTEGDGLARLERLLAGGTAVKLLYVVADYANPTGATLALEGRQRLTELAAEHGFLLVEDDPYGELGYRDGAARLPAIASLSPSVIRMGSFSKVLFPAARLGYLTGPDRLAPVLHTLKQAADLGNSRLLELLVNDLVRTDGYLQARIADARKLYRTRRDALAGALRDAFGRDLEFDVPDGGFFIWARLPGGASASRLLPEALAEGVSFVPGAAFYVSSPDDATLRLSFSQAPSATMNEAVLRLHRAWRRSARN
ncbi:MAG TPA: PLP-dependent aminotransferase family protein [Actinoplanes sp.]|nr:PLP-dependent aminotransferase family protein [Actinoplanes sp.]